MAGVIGVIVGMILFHGWKWILGKGGSLIISVIWLASTLFFGLSTLAPTFPIGWFKGMTCTSGTFLLLAVFFLSFFLAKAGIESATNSKAKGWVGGILAMLMATSFLGVWFICSAMYSANRSGTFNGRYEQDVHLQKSST